MDKQFYPKMKTDENLLDATFDTQWKSIWSAHLFMTIWSVSTTNLNLRQIMIFLKKNVEIKSPSGAQKSNNLSPIIILVF